MCASGQSAQQLGVHVNDKRGMEFEGMDGFDDSCRGGASSGTPSRKEAIIDNGIPNLPNRDHPCSVPDHSACKANDSSLDELERLYTGLLSTLQGSEPLTAGC